MLNLRMQPSLLTPVWQPGELIQFKLIGSPGQKCVLEMSADLTTWIPLKDVVLKTSEFQFFEPVQSAFTHAFYRAIPLP